MGTDVPPDAIREALNTVGKRGRLGEHVRCVVSVSMLTEGWDARNVRQIVGYRAFSTQLLCEQVTGRALRRTSYDSFRDPEAEPDKKDLLTPEYAEVLGIPFEFMPVRGTRAGPPPRDPTWVRTVEGRSTAHRMGASGRVPHPRPTGQVPPEPRPGATGRTVGGRGSRDGAHGRRVRRGIRALGGRLAAREIRPGALCGRDGQSAHHRQPASA